MTHVAQFLSKSTSIITRQGQSSRHGLLAACRYACDVNKTLSKVYTHTYIRYTDVDSSKLIQYNYVTRPSTC